MGNFWKERKAQSKQEKAARKAARSGRAAINGVPVALLQLADNLSPFRGAETFGIIKTVYDAEAEGRKADATRHNAGDWPEIWRRLESFREADSVFDQISAAVDEALPVMFMTGDTALQRKAVTGVLYAVELAQSQKVAARKAGHCDQADFWFGRQCFLHAFAHILEVWLDIKDSLPRRAWIHKIDAEDYLRISRVAMSQCGLPAGEDAIRAVDYFVAVLSAMDGAVFPPLEFCSSGYSYTRAHCSICGEDISGCAHVEGRVYCGRYCAKVRIQDLVFDHMARVDHPHDRRSIFLTASVNGVCRDTMTGQSAADENAVLVTAHGRLTLLPDITN